MSLWIMEHTSEMSRNISINLYLRPCGIAIYGKFYLYCLYHLRLFCSVNCENLVYKLCITFWKCQDTQTLFILECIQYWHKWKDYFQLLLFFKPFFLVSKLYELSQQIPQFFSGMLRNWGKVYIWGILVLQFMESSIPNFQYSF